MKIQNPLTYLLIIGILSFGSAQLPSKVPGLSSARDPDIGVLQEQFEDKCTKNGGPTAFETVQKSPEYLRDCVSSIVDATILRQEIQAAMSQGKLNTVFRKYCERVPSVTNCVENFADNYALCLEPEDKKNSGIIVNITGSLLEFICHNEGERVSAFIAAGGVDCIRYKRPEISACADEISRVYRQDVPEISDIPSLIMTRKDCTIMEKFRTCVVLVLESCPDPTPGNFVDSMFDFVRKVTPCEGLSDYAGRPTSRDVPANVGLDQEAANIKATGEESQKKSLIVKQIEAAEAQVRAAKAQERAALAQEQAAIVAERVGKTWLTMNRNPTYRYPARW